MDIQGPLKIGVLDDPNKSGWELHLNFTDDFKSTALEDQSKVFQAYLSELGREIATRNEEDRDRVGMLIIQQVGEQLMPHIQAGEIAMEETMVIEIARDQALSLTDLLNG